MDYIEFKRACREISDFMIRSARESQQACERGEFEDSAAAFFYLCLKVRAYCRGEVSYLQLSKISDGIATYVHTTGIDSLPSRNECWAKLLNAIRSCDPNLLETQNIVRDIFAYPPELYAIRTDSRGVQWIIPLTKSL